MAEKRISNGTSATRYDFQPADPSSYGSRKGGCCARRTRLEIALIVALVILALVAIALLVLVAKKQADFIATNCETSECIEEASSIEEYVNGDADPCVNFYEFACGNFLKNAHGDESLGLSPRLEAQAKRELIEAYAEPLDVVKDHKVVQMAKKLFRACFNENQIRTDDLKAVSDALRSVGGWPVVEGTKWNDTKFDWLKITYKLRKLGYEHNIFLELSAVANPQNATSYIYKVSTPNMWDYTTNGQDKIRAMTILAEKLGAKEKVFTEEEMRHTYQYQMTLQRELHVRFEKLRWTKYSIEDYQKKVKDLNWLVFINNLVGSANSVSKSDLVLFPPPEIMISWLKIIALVPNRTRANYMMWKLIELSLPYLPEEYGNIVGSRRRGATSRQDFCLNEVERRFVPSPIKVLCNRKYLSEEKKQRVEELVAAVKIQLITLLENTNWLNESFKQPVLAKANSINIIVGPPTNFFDDTILDSLNVDLVAPRDDSFLSLIAQANRNRQTILYTYVNKSYENVIYEHINNSPFSATQIAYYDDTINTLVVPLASTKDIFFKETRPKYLNFGAFANLLATQFARILVYPYQVLQRTDPNVKEQYRCLKDVIERYNLKDIENIASIHIFQQTIGQTLASGSYKKWTQTHGEEKKLIGIEYTPDQLFWISSVLPYCQPTDPTQFNSGNSVSKRTSQMTSATVRNVPQFAKDFGCAKNTEMNPSKKCQFF